MRLCSVLLVLLCGLVAPSAAFAQACPELMQTARRLVLVTVPNLTSSAGTLRLFERPRADAVWSRVGSAASVNVGSRGVAWGRTFRSLAGDGEPIKVEGDKRSPAGIYPIGRPFGFAPSPLASYLRLQPDNVCVEDPSSPAYNTITSEKAVHQSSSRDNMGAMPRYRRGLIVDYPTDAADRAGSCIFIHIWRSPASGTSGCVTMPEHRVAALQKFANEHPTVLALVPESALGKLGACLPAAVAERQ
jgi:L,D-peptidoglycan transpeptidase YkuD (ErfK/YbiS/YcfS/YnhG family)